MTKAEARRRRRIKREIQRTVAWAIVYALEAIAAAVPTVITAAVLLPIARWQRGYVAYGGEWLLIALVYCVAFRLAHDYAYRKIFEEG